MDFYVLSTAQGHLRTTTTDRETERERGGRERAGRERQREGREREGEREGGGGVREGEASDFRWFIVLWPI